MQTGGAFSIDDYKRMHEAYWKHRQTTVLTEHFSKKELAVLKECAKDAGVRLTGIAALEDEMIITYHLLKDDTLAEEEKYFYSVMKALKTENHRD